MEREIKIITTEDGSNSLYIPAINETYHSTHGALRESLHVFIKEGIDQFCKTNQQKQVEILEVGFGTGLNALLTLKYARENGIRTMYTSLEPYPLAEDIYSQLNYCEEPTLLDFKELFLRLHQVEWGRKVDFPYDFKLNKSKAKLEDFETETLYDIVYFDAFAPNKQSELWEVPVLDKVLQLIKPGGFLVTYCAKGQFKRDLKQLGFVVESIPGPPGKMEMVRASKRLA